MRDKINDPDRLELMLEAIANIEKYLTGVDRYDAFATNQLLCHAVI